MVELRGTRRRHPTQVTEQIFGSRVPSSLVGWIPGARAAETLTQVAKIPKRNPVSYPRVAELAHCSRAAHRGMSAPACGRLPLQHVRRHFLDSRRRGRRRRQHWEPSPSEVRAARAARRDGRRAAGGPPGAAARRSRWRNGAATADGFQRAEAGGRRPTRSGGHGPCPRARYCDGRPPSRGSLASAQGEARTETPLGERPVPAGAFPRRR